MSQIVVQVCAPFMLPGPSEANEEDVPPPELAIVDAETFLAGLGFCAARLLPLPPPGLPIAMPPPLPPPGLAIAMPPPMPLPGLAIVERTAPSTHSLRVPTGECLRYVRKHAQMQTQGHHVYQQSERIVPQGISARQRLEDYFSKPIYSREAFQNMESIIRERLPGLPEDSIFCHPPGHQDIQHATYSIAACRWCGEFQKKRGHKHGLQLRPGQLVFLACETRSDGKRKTNEETTVLRIKEPLSRDSSGAETGSHKICYAVDIETWDLRRPENPCLKSDGNFVLKLSKWTADEEENVQGALGELALWLSLPHGKEFKMKYGGLGFAQIRCGGYILHYQAYGKLFKIRKGLQEDAGRDI